MPLADSEDRRAQRQAWYRRMAQADADANGEVMYLILRPEDGPPTATGACRGSGSYWAAESVAEPWEKKQGERIYPAGAPPPPPPCPESRTLVMAEICAERARQDGLWGGAEHDDRHSLERWLVILVRHVGLACWDGSPDDVCHKSERTAKYDPARYRRELVEVAAVAVAALEAFDRRRAQQAAAQEEEGGSDS